MDGVIITAKFNLSNSLLVDSTEVTPMMSNKVKLLFTTIMFGFVCQIVVIVGIVTNTINMVVFAKLGFKDTINISLFALALSDFGSCFTLIWLNISKLPWIQELDLTFDPNQIQYLISSWPHILFTRITSLITAFVVVERCVCVTSPLKVKNVITRQRVILVIMSCYIMVIGSAIPIYYANRYDWKFYIRLNKSLVGLVFTKDRQEIEAIIGPLQNALFALLPFIVICVGTTILSISLKRKAAWRMNVTSGTKGNELSMKETKIVKMLMFISTLFIVCFLPNMVLNMWIMLDPDLSIEGRERNLMVSLGSIVFTLESINSALNAFIYYRNSSNYREMFNKIFKFRSGKDSK